MNASGSPPTGSPTQNGWGPMLQVALEQRYPPGRRITHDPLVDQFLPAYMKLLVHVGGSSLLREVWMRLMDSQVPGVRGGVLCRKRAIDDRLTEALAHGIEVVVNLGAGMDTRACRMPENFTVPVYEVDLPETVTAKAAVLRRVFGATPAHIHLVAADLDRQDVGAVLKAAGYGPGVKTLFIMEGVAQYITEAAVRALFQTTCSAAAGSQLAFTYIRRDFIDGEEVYGLETLYRMTRGQKERWQFGLDPATVAEFIAPYGWREVEQLGSDEYLDRYVRPTGRDITVMAIERLVFAEKM